jgi:hypothetical protein
MGGDAPSEEPDTAELTLTRDKVKITGEIAGIRFNIDLDTKGAKRPLLSLVDSFLDALGAPPDEEKQSAGPPT